MIDHGADGSKSAKSGLYAEIARIGKALSSGPRLQLLDLLAQGPRTVEALARETELSIANTSRHLQQLKRAQLVRSTHVGQHRRYALVDPDVAVLFATLRATAHARLDNLNRSVDELFGADADDDRYQGLTAEGLRERMASGEVTLIDVRPSTEFEHGHLPGAISVPLEDLEAHLEGLPSGRPVVAYCRGPYCLFARDAVTRLRAAGHEAYRSDIGVAGWRAANLPLAVEP